MYSIPIKANKFGAESLNQYPVRYGKSKVSGSLITTYIMHSKSGCMPGQSYKFIDNSRSIPNFNFSLKENRITRAFKIDKLINSKLSIGIKYSNTIENSFTYDEFQPNDDDSLLISINSVYRQVYGNFYSFESERPIELERRLRNGDITIREFVRQIAKSTFYKKHYFENVTQQRFIELNFKHLLGRPPFDQSEIVKSIDLLSNQGFDDHIDYLVDSTEYFESFGEHTVPFMRCWNSSVGIRTSSFINSYKIVQSFATSDNAIHSKISQEDLMSGQSILLNQLI